MKTETLQRVTVHGNQLKVMFNLNSGVDPVKLCKRLRQLEAKAHDFAVEYCNTGALSCESEGILRKLDSILEYRFQKIPVHFNSDARGYTLKIDSEWVVKQDKPIFRDMGGNGIIAPDLR